MKSGNGWQRDYIYYGITPSNIKGPFNYNFKEHLVSFEMVGNPRTALSKLADQTGDPQFDVNHSHRDNRYGHNKQRINSGWTDGEFEFKVKVYLGTKSPIGTELITYFRVAPSYLFGITCTGGDSNSISEIKLNKVELALPLFEWDLENYSSSIKIGIEEVDASETIIQTSSTTSEFATNFNFDVGFGQKVKFGLKFGASQKESRTISYQVSTTKGNDELGEVIVNFGDDIIMSRNLVGEEGRNGVILNPAPDYNNKYSTGWYQIHVAPLKMN